MKSKLMLAALAAGAMFVTGAAQAQVTGGVDVQRHGAGDIALQRSGPDTGHDAVNMGLTGLADEAALTAHLFKAAQLDKVRIAYRDVMHEQARDLQVGVEGGALQSFFIILDSFFTLLSVSASRSTIFFGRVSRRTP